MTAAAIECVESDERFVRTESPRAIWMALMVVCDSSQYMTGSDVCFFRAAANRTTLRVAFPGSPSESLGAPKRIVEAPSLSAVRATVAASRSRETWLHSGNGRAIIPSGSLSARPMWASPWSTANILILDKCFSCTEHYCRAPF